MTSPSWHQRSSTSLEGACLCWPLLRCHCRAVSRGKRCLSPKSSPSWTCWSMPFRRQWQSQHLQLHWKWETSSSDYFGRGCTLFSPWLACHLLHSWTPDSRQLAFSSHTKASEVIKRLTSECATIIQTKQTREDNPQASTSHDITGCNLLYSCWDQLCPQEHSLTWCVISLR